MSEPRSLAGRSAIVTGGASGIGRAVCRRLAAEGATVAVVDAAAGAADAAAAEIGGLARALDVRDAAAVDACFAEVAREMGGLDLLVNNAGVGALVPLQDTRDADWERLVGVNLTGTFHATRAALPHLRARARERGAPSVVVNNASASGLRPTRGEAAYSAAKAGVVALTRSTALEYGPDVRANGVAAGIVRTPMTEALFRAEGLLEPAVRATPLRRTGAPEDVADVIYFLCSDLSRYMTGQTLVVDGGLALPQAGIDDVLGALLEKMRGGR